MPYTTRQQRKETHRSPKAKLSNPSSACSEIVGQHPRENTSTLRAARQTSWISNRGPLVFSRVRAGRMAPTSDKFKSPICPLELRRNESQCSSGYAISKVVLHAKHALTDQTFGFFDGAKRNQTDGEQTAKLSWARWSSIPPAPLLRRQWTRFESTSTKRLPDQLSNPLRANS